MQLSLGCFWSFLKQHSIWDDTMGFLPLQLLVYVAVCAANCVAPQQPEEVKPVPLRQLQPALTRSE